MLGFGITVHDIGVINYKILNLMGIGTIFLFGLGYILSKIIKISAQTVTLITVGTAICGGSAIATIAPIINAKRHNVASSLTVVFLLNGLGMLVFPAIGHQFNLSDTVFGLWSAIAIHDTSSVIGAASSYSTPALKLAVATKSVRTLFIVPLAIGSCYFQKSRYTFSSFPWFLGLFIIVVGTVVFFPQGTGIYEHIFSGAKRLIAVPIFLLGTTVTLNRLLKKNKHSLLFCKYSVGFYFYFKFRKSNFFIPKLEW